MKMSIVLEGKHILIMLPSMLMAHTIGRLAFEYSMEFSNGFQSKYRDYVLF
jgi:hypothetical protein